MHIEIVPLVCVCARLIILFSSATWPLTLVSPTGCSHISSNIIIGQRSLVPWSPLLHRVRVGPLGPISESVAAKVFCCVYTRVVLFQTLPEYRFETLAGNVTIAADYCV